MRDPWEQQFRAAVKAVLDSETGPVTQAAALTVTPGSELVGADDEALLDALPPSSRLRALITRYTRREQYEQIVALCAERRQEVLALPPSELLVSQLLDAHLTEAQRLDDAALATAGHELALAFLPELERLRQGDRVRARLRRAGEATPVPDTAAAQSTLGSS